MKISKILKIGALAGLAAMGAAVLATAPAGAHHSFAMYDMSKTKTFTGKLTRFVPGANHAQLFFQVLDDNGNVVKNDKGEPLEWGVETGPAARIAQQGITVDAFPRGTIIKVSLNPLKDDRHFGNLARGTPIVKCGTEFPQGGCTKETGEVFTLGGGGP